MSDGYRVLREAEREWGPYASDPMTEGWDLSEFGERVLVSHALGGVFIGLRLVRLEPGQRSARYHRHREQEEVCWVLQGRCLAVAGEDQVELAQGDVIRYAPATAHEERAASEPALLLYMGAPNPGHSLNNADAEYVDPDR